MPVVTLGAIVNLAYLAILAVFFFFQPTNLEGFTFATGMLILATWALGLSGTAFWSWRAKKTAGISTAMLTGELPPE